MATKVSISSNALMLLGDQPINDFTDTSTRALLASNLWEFTKDAMIRSHHWACCTKRVQLAPDNTPPVFQFGYAFNIPGDCLAVLSIDAFEYPVTHKVEGTQILTNDNPIYLRYIFRNDIVESWDAGLVDIMTSAMAAAMAYPITRDAKMKKYYESEVFGKLRKIRAVDSQQSTSTGILSSPLVEVRGIG